MSTLVEISTAIIQPVGKPSPQVLRIIKTRNQTGRRHKVPAGSVDDDAFASTLPPKRDIGKEVAMMPDVGRRRVDKALPPIPPPATAAVPISDPIFLNHQPLDASGKRFYSSQTDLQSKVLPEPRIPSPPPAYSPTAEFTHQSPNFSNLSPDILDRPSPVPSPSVWSDLSTQTKQSAPAFEVQTPSTSPEVELPSPPILKHSQLSLKRSAAIRVNDRRTGLRRPLDSQDKKLVEQLPQPLLPNKNKALPLDPAIETVEALLNSKAQSAVVPCENQFTNEVMGGNQSSIDSKADANGLRQIFATKKRRTRHSSKEIVDDWNDSALSVTAAPPQPPIDRYKENVPPPMASSLALNGSPLPKGLEPQTPLRRRQASSSRSLSGSQSSLTPRKPPPPRIDTSFVLPPPIRKHSHTDSNTSATATIIAQYTEPTPPVTPLDGRPRPLSTVRSFLSKRDSSHVQSSSETSLEPQIVAAPPLKQSHFECYTAHKHMPPSRNAFHPVACMTCKAADSGMRWKCSWCCLRVCKMCMPRLDKAGRGRNALHGAGVLEAMLQGSEAGEQS